MPFVVVHTFEAPSHLEGSLTLVYIDHLYIHEIALYLHMGESVIEALVAPALGVDTEVGALDCACDIFKHATSLECSFYLGLPNDPICFVKVPSKSYH